MGATVDDLQLYALDLQEVIKQCNLNSASELEWFDRIEKELNDEG